MPRETVREIQAGGPATEPWPALSAVCGWTLPFLPAWVLLKQTPIMLCDGTLSHSSARSIMQLRMGAPSFCSALAPSTGPQAHPPAEHGLQPSCSRGWRSGGLHCGPEEGKTAHASRNPQGHSSGSPPSGP